MLLTLSEPRLPASPSQVGSEMWQMGWGARSGAERMSPRGTSWQPHATRAGAGGRRRLGKHLRALEVWCLEVWGRQRKPVQTLGFLTFSHVRGASARPAPLTRRVLRVSRLVLRAKFTFWGDLLNPFAREGLGSGAGRGVTWHESGWHPRDLAGSAVSLQAGGAAKWQVDLRSPRVWRARSVCWRWLNFWVLG